MLASAAGLFLSLLLLLWSLDSGKAYLLSSGLLFLLSSEVIRAELSLCSHLSLLHKCTRGQMEAPPPAERPERALTVIFCARIQMQQQRDLQVCPA